MPIGYLNSTTLINQIKLIGMIPASQNTFTDADFLSFANQEMRIGVIPSVMQYHQEFFVVDSKPVPIVAGQTRYPIPYRAIGGKLREVYYKDDSGSLRTMSRISPDNRPYFQTSAFQNNYIFFFVEGNEIVLIPDVGANPTGSLVFSYFLRPNDLVDMTLNRTGTITAISTADGITTLTLDNVPSGWTANSTKLDILQTNPGHRTYGIDVVPTAVVNSGSSKSISFSQDDVDLRVSVGDYVAYAGESIIPQCPSDLHDVLAQRVALRCLQSLGDQAGYGVAASKLQEMEKMIPILTDNRTEGQAVKINNARGLLRSTKLKRRGWGY